MNKQLKFEYGFESVNGIVKKHYFLHDIPNIKEKCDVWNMLPIKYVRQFTGLKDKNGKDIYEGDIMKIQLPLGGFWGNTKKEKTGEVVYESDYGGFIVKWEYSSNQHHENLTCDTAHEGEVIATIFENTGGVNGSADIEPENCEKEWIEKVCNGCPFVESEKVSHPGGSSYHSVDKHKCGFGHWEDDF